MFEVFSSCHKWVKRRLERRFFTCGTTAVVSFICAAGWPFNAAGWPFNAGVDFKLLNYIRFNLRTCKCTSKNRLLMRELILSH